MEVSLLWVCCLMVFLSSWCLVLVLFLVNLLVLCLWW